MDHGSHDHAAMGHDHHGHMPDMMSTVPSHDMHNMGQADPTHAAHDHGSMNDHGSMGSMHHMMSMTFHFGYNEVILIDQWKIESISGLIGSMIVIAIMAALYEGLKYYREYLFWKTYNSLQYRAVTVPEKPVVSEERSQVLQPTMFSLMHCFQTFLHILQVTISFVLMLIFMTYNVWLCLAVVIGAAAGYFLFGWKKSVIVDVTEHCH